MLMRAVVLAVLLCVLNSRLLAAQDCPMPAYAPKTSDQITDWHEKYINPALVVMGLPANPRPTRDQVEALVERLQVFHRRSIRDPLMFESLAQQISSQYAKTGDFRGLDTSAAEKLYKAGGGAALDFSAMCIDTRLARFPDDTFGITLFGVNNDDCRHASLRGLVFTGTLINGAENGECRPDHRYFKSWVVPVMAGTNTVTFVCNKDANGCARR